MKKFYYVCPRCGRQWVRFIPRSKMKCRFCAEVWHTRGRRTTRSKFSWTATFLWLFVLAAITLGVLKFQTIVGFAAGMFKSDDTVKEEEKENLTVPPIRFKSLDEIRTGSQDEKPEGTAKPKVPPIRFRSVDEIESEKVSQSRATDAAEKTEASESASDAQE